jgi:hypothetical protein
MSYLGANMTRTIRVSSNNMRRRIHEEEDT